MPDHNSLFSQIPIPPTAQAPAAQSSQGPLRVTRVEPVASNPNHPPPAWVFIVGVIVLAGIVTAIAVWMRRTAYRTWQAFAREIGGEFRAKNALSPAVVSGSYRNRPILLETGLSHEDDAPYYHTRGRAPLKNVGSFILGLRHKSLLEQAQTRRDPPQLLPDEPEFERLFFLYCNDPNNLKRVLSPEVRQELRRYSDIEVYVRMGEIEWRRAGEEASIRVLRRLSDITLDLAEAIDRLPSRGRSLSEVLEDEKMIEKGL